jgi:hypothetical protein
MKGIRDFIQFVIFWTIAIIILLIMKFLVFIGEPIIKLLEYIMS